MSLNELHLGEKATIVNLSSLNRYIKRRLLDLGILEGEEVLLKNRMPFHGPFMIEHNGQILGIRYREALQIEIKTS
ncbi:MULTISPECIES: FeoA family protein [Rummeliibacillus]|jgi:ferrous iron transport protein A|uniref:FeoA family protein n=1 Tax=Rummeliibacillus TaxID=648802 RepID=UPI0011B46AA9|nr:MULTISPECIES: FeoA family protein [Rummeliibacillus]MBO2534947.1 ferrous iron transport protein A [Rummeliibacillus suwonensis]